MSGTCPCIQSYVPEAKIYATVGGTPTAPRVEYFGEEVPVTEAMLVEWEKSPLNPTEVLRFSAPCKEDRCKHWDPQRSEPGCSVPMRFIASIEVDQDTALPNCGVRSRCQWYYDARKQGGIKAGLAICRRCQLFPTDTVSVAAGADPLSVVDIVPTYL
jgi:hypothetical protein